MKFKICLILFVYLTLFNSKTIFAQTLNSSHSPIVMLPSAEIAQGIVESVKNSLETYYHTNYPDRFPQDLQLELINCCNLTFLPNSNLMGILSVISYNNEPSTMLDAMRNRISIDVRTIIITKIDSRGGSIIEFRVKAISVLSNSIITEEGITFPIAEIDMVAEKIRQLARKICEDTNEKISIGIGFGYQKRDHITLSNILKEIRTTPPHPNDIVYRSHEILNPDNPDNYLIIENTVHIVLEHRISLAVNLRVWGILNIAIQTSAINESRVIETENYFRKSYIKEGAIGGDALIYYLVRSKKRSFIDGNSFSLPIYITYPILYFGKNKEAIFHLVGGTNLLLPEKISFEAEKGWHRFNERQKDTTFDLGELKETKFFAGFDIEGAFTKSIRLGFQFTFVYTESQEDFNVPLSLQQSNKVLLSLRLNFIKLFDFQ